MPRRKDDATNDDVAPRDSIGDRDELLPETNVPAGDLPPAGAESEPPLPAEQRALADVEPLDTVTVDAAVDDEPTESLSSFEPVAPPPDTSRVDERRPEEDHHEEADEEGWSLPARMLTALVLILAGAVLGIWAAPRIAPVLPSGMRPVAEWLTPGATASRSEIDAVRARLDEGLGGVEARFADLPSGSDVQARIDAAVSASEGRVSGEIASLRDSVGQLDGAGTRQELDRLEASIKGQVAELGSLKDQLAGTTAATGQLSEEAVQRIDVYRAELDGLRAEMGTLQDKVSGLSAHLDEVAANADREIATAQTRVGEIQSQAATALGAAETDAALALLRAAVASGQPFAEPLSKLGGQPGIAVPEGLTAAAASGVPTLAQLRDSYPDAAHAAIRASIMAGAGEGALARGRAFLQAQMASRSLTPQAGVAPDAVLSRMEDRLGHDDLQGVLDESAALPSEAAAAMSGWLGSAKLRLGAEEGLAALNAAPASN